MEFKDTSLETKSSLRYGEPMIDEKIYKKTAYDYMFSKNSSREENIAIAYLGNEISYGQFKEIEEGIFVSDTYTNVVGISRKGTWTSRVGMAAELAAAIVSK